MIELTPCPFCGSNNLYVRDAFKGYGSAFVGCGECHVEGPCFDAATSDDEEAAELKAIAAWNRRVDPA